MADAQPIFQRLEVPNAPETQSTPPKKGGKKNDGKKQKGSAKQKADSAVVNASAS